ncbi:SurA N-terminal domain-containing protein [Methylibium sp.]|uniref:SurA N-terminal domain-containing protein n=1 Tax=Methylibium sp. TaxID=2067992 RepID=UPI003D138D92
MFEFVRSHTRLFQFVLVLLVFPAFVFFGVQGYTGFSGGNASVAKVAGHSITQAEWDAAHRKQVERLRAQSPGVDLKVFDTPEAKQNTLDALVRERVMLVAADKLHLTASDEHLQRVFASDPQLAFLRKPDGSLNAELLAAQGLNARQFEQQLRQDLAMRQVLLGISGTALAPSRSTAEALDAVLQQREVRIARFEAKNFVVKVHPSDADIEAYYKDARHASEFETPEQASLEYLVLDLDAIKSGLTVSEEDLRKYYAENEGRYTTPQERRASHILIKAERSASAEQREKAKAKATALLAQAKQDPGKFAELAKKNSEDPGSAVQGGDLDFFARGAMVKPFEDAAFALKPGQLGDVVESDFGYHVILLTAVRGGEKKPFDAVKAEIENEVKQQLAQRRFAEAAETFSNTVYEQADSLKPAAEKLKLTVRTATGVTRAPAQGATGALANPKFLEALFATDTLRNKRNTEAVDLGGNQLAAGRVVEYAPSRKLPLTEVKERVRERVVAEQSATLARTEGLARLAAWKGGAEPEGLEPALKVSRNQQQALPPALIDAVMKAPPAPLPSWTGVDFGEEGYAVVRIDKLLPRDTTAADEKRLQQQYAQIWGAAEDEAYYAALKERYKVKITGVAKGGENESTGVSR